MKEIKIEKCPFCGGTEFIDGRACSYGGVYISTGMTRSAAVYVTVCRDCGSIVRSYCNNHEKLLPKKERRK